MFRLYLFFTLLTLTTLSVGAFVNPTEAATPNGRFGWYTPHGEVVGDDASCGVGKNKMELVLRERGTGNPATVASAIFLTQAASGAIVSSVSGTGPTIGTICYDPSIHSLGISIDGGAGYYNFEASIVATSSALIPRGKHIRSIVWLAPTSISDFEYAQEYPVNTITNINPTYQFRIKHFPNEYGASALSRGMLFVNQWINGNVWLTTGIRRETALSGGLGLSSFPALATLADGFYSWAFYANLNGSHDPGFGVKEVNEPKSGLAWFNQPFTLDRTPPQLNAPGHSPAAPTSAQTVSFGVSGFDAHAGFARVEFYMDGVLRHTCPSGGQTNLTCNTPAFGPFTGGTTVSYYFVAYDRVGYTATSTVGTFTVVDAPILPDLYPINRYPFGNTAFELNTLNSFYATVTNSVVTNFAGTNARVWLQVDYNTDGWIDVNTPANNGAALNPFAPGDSQDVSAAVFNIPTGRHRYRFYVDTGSLIDETNESNNYSDWTTFHVGAVGSVAATPYVCGQITVSWAPVYGAVSYTIFDNGVPLVNTTLTTYAHRNIIPGSTHNYQIRANFWSGSLVLSGAVTATAPAACTPDVPDLVTQNQTPSWGTSFLIGDAINFGGSVTNVSLSDIPEGGTAILEIDFYQNWSIDRSISVVPGNLLGAFTSGEQKNIASLQFAIPSGTHRYRFQADTTNVIQESNEDNNVSNWVTFYVVPNTPSSISATPQNCNTRTIYVNWSNASGADSYTLLDNGEPIATTSSSAFNHTGLVEGSSHFYQVRSNNPGGQSAYSNGVAANAPVACPSFSSVGVNSQPPAVSLTVSSPTIFAGETVDVTWNTRLGGTPDSCEASGPYNPAVNWDGGTETVTLNTVGETTFILRCVNNDELDFDTVVVVVNVLPASQPPVLTAEPTVVRAGEKVRLRWDTNNIRVGGEAACTLKLGSNTGPLVIPTLSNGVGSDETGFTDVVVNSESTYVLTCVPYETSATVEIRPVVTET